MPAVHGHVYARRGNDDLRMTLMTDRPDEMHPTPTEDRPERGVEKQSRGTTAIPNDMVDRPDLDKPTRGLRWRSDEDVDEPPEADG